MCCRGLMFGRHIADRMRYRLRGPAQFGTFLNQEIDKWGKAIRECWRLDSGEMRRDYEIFVRRWFNFVEHHLDHSDAEALRCARWRSPPSWKTLTRAGKSKTCAR